MLNHHIIILLFTTLYLSIDFVLLIRKSVEIILYYFQIRIRIWIQLSSGSGYGFNDYGSETLERIRHEIIQLRAVHCLIILCFQLYYEEFRMFGHTESTKARPTGYYCTVVTISISEIYLPYFFVERNKICLPNFFCLLNKFFFY